MKSGLFYPPDVTSAEARLQFYASRFPVVEADTTYYGLLSRHVAQLWVERTPANFRFDVKSFSLFTHHPTKPQAWPKGIREAIPEDLRQKNLYADKLPAEIVDEAWAAFRAGVAAAR